MKTLLKIALMFVFALFVSMSVKAADPTGTITVNCPSTLTLSVTTPSVSFTYNYLGGTGSLLTPTTPIEIKANVNWKFKINSAEDELTSIDDEVSDGGNTFDASKISFNVPDVMVGNLSSAGVESPSKYGPYSDEIEWTLANLGNQFAGTYQVGVTYSIVRAAD